MENEVGQMSLLDPDTWSGKTCLEHSPLPMVKISKRSSKKPSELCQTEYIYLDLRDGYGNLLGAFWESNSPLLGEYWMLNTGESHSAAVASFLSQILEVTPLPKYYLSKTACLGILRRAKARDKELPKQLKDALMIQAEILNESDIITEEKSERKSYHINQRNEGIDLDGLSGALMATQTMQMQTFVTEPFYCINDQGGQRMDITDNITTTLRASMGGNLPIVMGSGQANATISTDICPTITSAAGMGGNNQPILFDNHARDCRYNGPLDVAPTIAATYGTGGNNTSLVLKPIQESYCIASNTINRQDQHGGNGQGVQKDISYTLTTSDIHAIFSPEPYQNIVGTLMHRDHKGVNTCYVNQDKCIVAPYQDQVGALCNGDYRGPSNQYVSQDKCIVDDPKVFGQSSFANYKEGCATLRAEGGDSGGGSENLALSRNLVRRLTPTECERLQGFPDNWTNIPKATDSPRYKALGNSVAIPCVDFVMRGIAYFLTKQKEMEES